MMSALNRIWIVFQKEVIDNLRDRRSISSSMLTSAFMPVFMVVLIMVVGRAMLSDVTDAPLDLPVAGAENAPGLIQYLKENNVNVLPAPADPQAAVREGEVKLVLIIPPEYGEAFTEGRPAPVRAVFDSTRQSAMSAIERARRLVDGYAGTIAVLRLHARGVDPALLNVLQIERDDLATPQGAAVIFLNMMPFLLVMTIFSGGMYVVIDTTAGERERGSLEPLLINPVRRWEMVLGKLLASLPFATVSLVVALVLFGVGFNVVPLEEYTGIPMNMDTAVLMNIFWLSVPIIFLSAGAQMVVAAFTRSFKEAQTYLGFLPLVAGLPGAFLAFMPVHPSVGVMLVPIFSQSVMINQFMRGETVLPLNLAVSTIATFLAALALVVLAIRLYQREKVLFGVK